MAKKKKDQHNLGKEKMQNLVAKHSRNMAGAGAHVEKKGDKAPRVRQKRAWKKSIQYENSLIGQANAELAYDSGDDFEQALKDIEATFDINLSEDCGSSHENEESGFTSQQTADMNKLISQYKSDGAGDIGEDLEMLEYNPEEVASMIAYIRSALKK